MTKPDYLGPYPDLYVGGQRLWKVFAGDKQVWPEGFQPMWVCYGTRSGANQAYILYSEDGENWSRVDIDIPVRYAVTYELSQHSIAVDPATNTFIVMENSDKIWRSVDGENWSSTSIASGRNVNSVSYGNGVWIAGIGRTGSSAVNYHAYGRSTDSETWTETSLPKNLGVAANEIHANHYTTSARVMSSLQRRFRSTDNGTTWTDSNPLNRQFAFASNGSGVLVSLETTGGNFYKSTDGGSSWTLSSTISGFTNGMLESSLSYGDGVWIATGISSTSTVWKSTDNCATWTAIQSAMSSPSVDIVPGYRSAYNHRDSEWVVAGRNNATTEAVFWKSSDGAATWDGPFETSFGGNVRSLIHNSGLPDTKLP